MMMMARKFSSTMGQVKSLSRSCTTFAFMSNNSFLKVVWIIMWNREIILYVKLGFPNRC